MSSRNDQDAPSFPEASPPSIPGPPDGRSVRRMPSERLLRGARELVIEHQGYEYHLRLTRNDKLILTK